MSNFIPKGYSKEQFSLRMERKKLERVDLLAGKYNMSRNEFINQCVDYALENMLPEDQEP